MKKTYKLYNAITLNVSRRKVNAFASPVTARELRKHRHHFQFDFISIAKSFVVYKVYLENQPDIIQGLVAFRSQRLEGYISFEAKNRLIPYYQRLGAQRIGNSKRMFIDDAAAHRLIALYF